MLDLIGCSPCRTWHFLLSLWHSPCFLFTPKGSRPFWQSSSSLAIRGLGENTKFGSSCMVMSIVGGSIMPIVMGWVADHFNMGIGFLIPLVCFILILIYGFFWKSLFVEDTSP